MDHLNSPLYNDTPAETQALSWGRIYLMCPPDYFGIFYEINPWMHTENAANRDRAQEQWHHLVAHLRRAGAAGGVRCLTLALDVSYQHLG